MLGCYSWVVSKASGSTLEHFAALQALSECPSKYMTYFYWKLLPKYLHQGSILHPEPVHTRRV